MKKSQKLGHFGITVLQVPKKMYPKSHFQLLHLFSMFIHRPASEVKTKRIHLKPNFGKF